MPKKAKPESIDKDEASAEPSASSMEKFRALAKRLVRVSKEDLEREVAAHKKRQR